jgi:rod shape-determining protein MreD
VRVAGVVLALALALALQTTLGRLASIGGPVDLVLVVVLMTSLTLGPIGGVLAGTVGGIAQDALAGGIIGLSGLAKSPVGYLAGTVSRQFIVTQPLPRFVVFFCASVAHMGCLIGLGRLVSQPLGATWPATLAQAAVNAAVGIVAFQMGLSGPAMWQRRQLDRRHRVSRWLGE